MVAHATRGVGVRDTALKGSPLSLRKAVSDAYSEVLSRSGLRKEDVWLAVAFGMITSELGLCELPHVETPADAARIAEGIKCVEDQAVTGLPMPVYFIPGVRNPVLSNALEISNIGNLDFMRGEETQIIGLVPDLPPDLPLVVAVLSSHTKFVFLDPPDKFVGSLTTLSGQLFHALLTETSLSKSVAGSSSSVDIAKEQEIIDLALTFCRDSGFLRTLMVTRFLDTLVKTTLEQRRLFLEAAFAAEDCHALLGQLDAFAKYCRTVVLMGPEPRVRLYEAVVRRLLPEPRELVLCCQRGHADVLAIRGALKLIRLAGIIEEES